MASPTEYKTVQTRILAYAQEIGWAFVPREEAERRRRFDMTAATPEERARKSFLFFGDLLHAQVLAFNPKYKEAEGALVGEFQRFIPTSTVTGIFSRRCAINTSFSQRKTIASWILH